MNASGIDSANSDLLLRIPHFSTTEVKPMHLGEPSNVTGFGSGVMAATSRGAIAAVLLLMLMSMPVQAQVSGRSQSTWSGSITLAADHTIPVSDELIISACTNVTMHSGVRIVVEGRLTIEGTSNCPVVLKSAGTGDHEGIQFNASSTGRGSVIDNLTISTSEFGITMFGGDAQLNNITVIDADNVAVDLFDSASPRIENLEIIGAGNDVGSPVFWRYGIGLSIGAGSAPIVDGVSITQAVTRGLNIWGNSGGMLNDVVIEKVSGATLAYAAGIWVEDSRPLIQDVEIDESDNGVIIRHISDAATTRPVLRDVDITDSMYRGLLVDKADRNNYTNYQATSIQRMMISGTGGPNAKTSGLAEAAIEINASGGWFEDIIVKDNDAVGLNMYFSDWNTVFRNLTIENSGEDVTGIHRSGLLVHSSYFAPDIEGLSISGSRGSGIYLGPGGSLQGSDWNLSNNGADGLHVDSAAMIGDNLTIEDNSQDAIEIFDSRYVELSNLTSSGNTGGLHFTKSNDVQTASGDVRCRYCITRGDGTGVVIENSVDLWLEELEVHNPLSGSAITADNSDLYGAQGGVFNLHGVEVWINTSLPAIDIDSAHASLIDVMMNGSHDGLHWDADSNGNHRSTMSGVQLSGAECLRLENHSDLYGIGNSITTGCTGGIFLENSQVNWSGFADTTTDRVLNLDSNSHLRLHKPVGVDLDGASIAPSGAIDISYDIDLWVLNNLSNGVPFADYSVTFSQIEPSTSGKVDADGRVNLNDRVIQRWDDSGSGAYTDITIDCSYDGVSNQTTVDFEEDIVVVCGLPLENQPPFVVWSTPTDQQIFPSSAQVVFNASDTWDIDDDQLSFEWTSSIDGLISQLDIFTVNDGQSGILLSDGIHDIELKVCDESNHCITSSRTIELSNQAPVISVSVTPGLTPFGDLYIPRTSQVTFNLTGTLDAENDPLRCWVDYPTSPSISEATDCVLLQTIDMAQATPTEFELTIFVCDDVNPCSEWKVDVDLYNELPYASFEIDRDANTSDARVTLNGSATIDPEGDDFTMEWHSSLDGYLGSGPIWQGYLSRGYHEIQLVVADDNPENVNKTASLSKNLQVDNSRPIAIINSPSDNSNLDTSQQIEFSAMGSGDMDSACDTFPEGDWVCSLFEPNAGSEWLVVTWTSDIDGRLTPEGEDWLIFKSRLSAGWHNITLSLDDGIHQPVTDVISVSVDKSAPMLNISSPEDGKAFSSSTAIIVDIRNSVDYDGDEFSFDLSSNLDGILLSSANPSEIHHISLSAGSQILTFTLNDSTGAMRSDSIELFIDESDPIAVINSPRDYIEPGEMVVLDANGTYDADDDLVRQEWRLWNGASHEVISTSSYEEIRLEPGFHHISLFVRDSRGGSAESHVNITVGFSAPDIDPSSLEIEPGVLNSGELQTLKVSVLVVDLDGTTDNVTVKVKHGVQEWEFNLSDINGDSIWEGEIKLRPEGEGRPQVLVIADDSGRRDSVSAVIEVHATEDGFSWVAPASAGAGGLVILIILLNVLLARRKRRAEELEIVENWGVWGESKSYENEEIEAEMAEQDAIEGSLNIDKEV